MTKVYRTIGNEGPSYDPYAFEEYIIERPGRPAVKVHLGLSVSIDGIEYGDTDDNFTTVFEDKVGVTLKAFEKAYQRITGPPSRCDCGRSVYHARECSGYPGESFLICDKCDAILHVAFNESAII
jgi:hypothetical protein